MYYFDETRFKLNSNYQNITYAKTFKREMMTYTSLDHLFNKLLDTNNQ